MKCPTCGGSAAPLAEGYGGGAHDADLLIIRPDVEAACKIRGKHMHNLCDDCGETWVGR